MIQDLFKSVQEDMSKDADLNASAQAQPASATSSVQSVQRQATQDVRLFLSLSISFFSFSKINVK